MKVLIGTHNRDKASLVASLMTRANPAMEVHFLDEFHIRERAVERGSLLNRATTKAFTYEQLIDHRGDSGFSLFVGVDDGIEYAGQQCDICDSTAASKALLVGNAEDGVRVTIHHAIALLSRENRSSSFVASIPLKYRRPVSPLVLSKEKYSLFSVLCMPTRRRTLSATPHSEYVDYCWNIASSELIRALSACGISRS
jgi:hypothetical protein